MRYRVNRQRTGAGGGCGVVDRQCQNPRRWLWYWRRVIWRHFCRSLCRSGGRRSQQPEMLHFVQEFGLILFVYTIGIQVGPGFLPPCGSPACGSIFSLSALWSRRLVTAVLHKAVQYFRWFWHFLRRGHQHPGARCGPANPARSGDSTRHCRPDGDELRHGLSVWHLWHSALHVAGTRTVSR